LAGIIPKPLRETGAAFSVAQTEFMFMRKTVAADVRRLNPFPISDFAVCLKPKPNRARLKI
jgi:hypothetical protein